MKVDLSSSGLTTSSLRAKLQQLNRRLGPSKGQIWWPIYQRRAYERASLAHTAQTSHRLSVNRKIGLAALQPGLLITARVKGNRTLECFNYVVASYPWSVEDQVHCYLTKVANGATIDYVVYEAWLV